MTWRVVPFSTQDFDRLLPLADAAVPFDPEGNRDWLQKRQQFDEGRLARRHYLVEDADTQEALGYGVVEQDPARPERFRAFIVADPTDLRVGVGDWLFEHLLQDLEALEAEVVWVREYRRDPVVLDFFQSRGFVETQSAWDLRLSLTDGLPHPLARAAAELGNKGIAITTLAREREGTPDGMERLHSLVNSLLAAEASAGAFNPIPFEGFLSWLERPEILPEGYFIAVQQGQYVGVGYGTPVAKRPTRLTLAWLAARREALAVTAGIVEAVAGYAQEQGYRTIVAHLPGDRKETKRLYESLGFQSRFEYVTLERHCAGRGDDSEF